MPRSKTISAATRESEQPKSTAKGFCWFAASAQRRGGFPAGRGRPPADDVDDPGASRHDDRLQLAVHLQLAHEALDVAANAVHRQLELASDLHRVLAVREPLEHLVLAGGEPRGRPRLPALLRQG